jgi:Mycothiol-dependent nitroreductase Rv2466c
MTNSETYDVEFFWDPVCPWAWLTSRWVTEVAGLRGLSVDWRFICLRLLNAHRDYEKDFSAGYTAVHGSGRKLLRVAAAVRESEGRARMADLYTQFGGDIHVRGRRDEIVEHYEDGFPDYLRSIGIADEYLAAANDEKWDAVLQAETDEALSRTGKDLGTPIISFTSDGTTASFFGPVISRVPRGDEALRLWDAVWEVATFPGLSELKRSLREKPQLADSLDGAASPSRG